MSDKPDGLPRAPRVTGANLRRQPPPQRLQKVLDRSAAKRATRKPLEGTESPKAPPAGRRR
jgi:hypothetical protein